MTTLQLITLILTTMAGVAFTLDFIFMASAKEITKVKAAVYSGVVVAMCAICTLVILGIV